MFDFLDFDFPDFDRDYEPRFFFAGGM